jgi:hypothetical protein
VGAKINKEVQRLDGLMPGCGCLSGPHIGSTFWENKKEETGKEVSQRMA